MKQLRLLFVLFLTVFLFNTVPAQEAGSMRGNYKHIGPQKIQKLLLDPLPAGTYTIGNGGDFPTIDSAFNKLSIDGIAGEVTLELIDSLYIAPATEYGFRLDGPIQGADKDNRLYFGAQERIHVTIEGNGGSVLSLINTSYLSLSVPYRGSLKIHALYNSQFPWNDCVDVIDNSNHNEIRGLRLVSDDYTRACAGIAFWVSDNTVPFAPDSNLIEGNIIVKAGMGIYMDGLGQQSATGNIIRLNTIGSESDSLITWGIQLFHTQNSVIEDNWVENLRHNSNAGIFNDVIHGINSYWGDSTIIRDNIIHNIYGTGTLYGAAGILLSGGFGEEGNNNMVYNNMIYDIRNLSNQTVAAGIQLFNQNNASIYYNSVYLDGTGSSPSNSAAFNVQEECSDIVVKNNIFVNTRNEQFSAYAIYDYSPSNLISDYNDLYCTLSQNNYLVKIGSTNYTTLGEWQASGNDLSSITEMPNFIEPDLHINDGIPTNLESHATPISGIEVDIDSDIRNPTSPDIGADEFNGIVGVENSKSIQPLEFRLEQNFPNPFNPATTIRYSVPNTSRVQINVYDVLGNETGTLINEEKPAGNYEITWDAANLPSGVYFYQLRAGEFTGTNKMILLK